MTPRFHLGCIGAISGWLLLAMLSEIFFQPYVDSRWIAGLLLIPSLFFMPWGPPLFFAWAFVLVGPSMRQGKKVARGLSGVALSLACLYLTLAAAFTGRFVWEADVPWVVSGFAALSMVLGVYGFRRDPEPRA